MEHRLIGASEIGGRKSAWDADDEEDAWKVEVEEEVARAKAAEEEEEERKRERDRVVVAGSTKRDHEDDRGAYGATSPVLNNWMIHFSDE